MADVLDIVEVCHAAMMNRTSRVEIEKPNCSSCYEAWFIYQSVSKRYLKVKSKNVTSW